MRGTFVKILLFLLFVSTANGLFYWARQGSTYWCIEPYTGYQSPYSFYGYNSSTSSSTLPFQAQDTSFVFFYMDTTHDSLAVIYLHDKHTDHDGGSMRLLFNGLPSYIHMFQDDPTDANDSIFLDHATWAWSTCCTDGAILSGFSTDSCFAYTTTMTSVTGIHWWLLLSDSFSTLIELDMTEPLQLGCSPDTPYFSYRVTDTLIPCDSPATVLITNPLCAEMLFQTTCITDSDSIVCDSIVAVPENSSEYPVTFSHLPENTNRIVVNPLLPCIPPETLFISFDCCPEASAKLLCPSQERCYSFTSCQDQTISFLISLFRDSTMYTSTYADTNQIYFTIGVQHPDTTTDIIYLQSNCGCFTFDTGDTLRVIFHSECEMLDSLIHDGDMVTIQLDSMFTTTGCKIEFR